MPERRRRADALKKVRSRVEHVFAVQKHEKGLFVRTIGLERATTRSGPADLVHTRRRLVLVQSRSGRDRSPGYPAPRPCAHPSPAAAISSECRSRQPQAIRGKGQ